MTKGTNIYLSWVAVFLGLALGGAAAQDASICIVRGFGGNGPIVIGRIIKSEVATPDRSAMATISITKSLRGALVQGQVVDVEVVRTRGSVFTGWPEIWQDVRPDVGKDVLIMFQALLGSMRPSCVLEVNSGTAGSLNTVTRMIELENLPSRLRNNAMLKALSDPTSVIRDLALDYLTGPRVHDPQVRLAVFRHFALLAADVQKSNRRQALASAAQAYDTLTPDSAVNYLILSFVADRMSDEDPGVRTEALQFIDGLFFGGGSQVPDAVRVKLTNPKRIQRQLQSDITAATEHAGAAERVNKLLFGHH